MRILPRSRRRRPSNSRLPTWPRDNGRVTIVHETRRSADRSVRRLGLADRELDTTHVLRDSAGNTDRSSQLFGRQRASEAASRSSRGGPTASARLCDIVKHSAWRSCRIWASHGVLIKIARRRDSFPPVLSSPFPPRLTVAPHRRRELARHLIPPHARTPHAMSTRLRLPLPPTYGVFATTAMTFPAFAVGTCALLVRWKLRRWVSNTPTGRRRKINGSLSSPSLSQVDFCTWIQEGCLRPVCSVSREVARASRG